MTKEWFIHYSTDWTGVHNCSLQRERYSYWSDYLKINISLHIWFSVITRSLELIYTIRCPTNQLRETKTQKQRKGVSVTCQVLSVRSYNLIQHVCVCGSLSNQTLSDQCIVMAKIDWTETSVQGVDDEHIHLCTYFNI